MDFRYLHALYSLKGVLKRSDPLWSLCNSPQKASAFCKAPPVDDFKLENIEDTEK